MWQGAVGLVVEWSRQEAGHVVCFEVAVERFRCEGRVEVVHGVESLREGLAEELVVSL